MTRNRLSADRARFFAIGPLEWAWRSLAYGRRQPFRHRRGGDPAVVIGP